MIEILDCGSNDVYVCTGTGILIEKEIPNENDNKDNENPRNVSGCDESHD